MDHYSTEIASTLSRASADAYRPKVEARIVGLNWQPDGSSLIVAHRGTQITSVTDWRNNLDLETGETLLGKARLKVHAGFFAAWRAAFPWLWLRITHHRPQAVYVTGRSLGALQAVLTTTQHNPITTKKSGPIHGAGHIASTLVVLAMTVSPKLSERFLP